MGRGRYELQLTACAQHFGLDEDANDIKQFRNVWTKRHFTKYPGRLFVTRVGGVSRHRCSSDACAEPHLLLGASGQEADAGRGLAVRVRADALAVMNDWHAVA